MKLGRRDLATHVIDCVAHAWNEQTNDVMTRYAILSKSRIMSVTTCRHIAIYILREKYRMHFEAIGGAMKLHHTSAIHACKQVKNMLDTNAPECIVLHRAFELTGNADVKSEITLKPVSLYVMFKGISSKHRRVMRELIATKNEVWKLKRAMQMAERSNVESNTIKPKNWTEDELKRLRQYRSKGATVSIP